MKKSLLILVALFGLTACPANQPTVTTAALQQKVLAAEVAYEVPLALALAYNNRPRCTTPPTVVFCSDPAVVDVIRKTNHNIQTALAAAMTLASTPGVTDSAVTAAIASATQLIGPLQSILDSYK